MSKIDYNKCYYSPGNKNPHTHCTHPTYCLFNQNRIKLETQLQTLKKRIQKLTYDYDFIRREGTTNSTDYETIKERIKILKEDYEKLNNFKDKIMENGREEYAYNKRY